MSAKREILKLYYKLWLRAHSIATTRDGNFTVGLGSVLRSGQGTEPYVTLRQAAEQNLGPITFGWPGIGDEICLLSAVTRVYEATGHKTLLAVGHPELFAHSAACHVLMDLPAGVLWDALEADQTACDTGRVSLHGMQFAWLFAPYNCLYEKTDAQGRPLDTWPKTHIIGAVMRCLGLSGTQPVEPVLCLSDQEIAADACPAARPRVCVMTGGYMTYKSIPVEMMQTVVDALAPDADIVQIGASRDPKLRGAQDKRGALGLRQLAAFLHGSSLFIGAIGGLMHMAAAVGTPSVIAHAA